MFQLTPERLLDGDGGGVSQHRVPDGFAATQVEGWASRQEDTIDGVESAETSTGTVSLATTVRAAVNLYPEGEAWFIDDVVVRQGSDHVELDVRIRNPEDGVVNITRADLEVLERSPLLGLCKPTSVLRLARRGRPQFNTGCSRAPEQRSRSLRYWGRLHNLQYVLSLHGTDWPYAITKTKSQPPSGSHPFPISSSIKNAIVSERLLLISSQGSVGDS